MIYQSRNYYSMGTAIAVAFLLLSPRAVFAANDEDAKASQEAAATMLQEVESAETSSTAEFNKEEPVYKAAKDLQAVTAEWKIKAADWKTKADEWATAPGAISKSDAAKAAKKAADDAKVKYDEAFEALSEARSGTSAQDKATFQSDYDSKHFSLVAGAVVLNPFKLESVDTDMDPSTREFRVETGNTDANALLEMGFRRRWAWENWENAELRDESRTLEAIKKQLAAEKSKPEKEKSKEMIKKWGADVLELEQRIANLRSQYGVTSYKSYSPFLKEIEKCFIKCTWTVGKAIAEELLMPKNFAVRLGFALGSDEPSGAAAVAGAGDFYIETGLGIDWVRALYPTGGEPLRFAFGPELFLSFNNDSELGDFHQRILAGFAFTAGVPLGEGEERLAEIVARMGWVSVEVPSFLDSQSRLIRVENEVADFERDGGFGFDVEMNIPITKELGYVFLRATSNHGFDPNPWTVTVGYTLPINQIAKRLRP